MPTDAEELRRLTDRLITEEISDEEFQRLNALMAANLDLVRDYVREREVEIAIRSSQALILVEPPVVDTSAPRGDMRASDSALLHFFAAVAILLRQITSPGVLQAFAVLLVLIIGALIGFLLL